MAGEKETRGDVMLKVPDEGSKDEGASHSSVAFCDTRRVSGTNRNTGNLSMKRKMAVRLRLIRQWNRLLREIVSSPPLEMLRT